MSSPIERPWNAERDAARAEEEHEYREKKSREKKGWWTFAIAAFVILTVLYIFAEVGGSGSSSNACDDTRRAYERWQNTNSPVDYDTYRAAMARCAVTGYE